MEHELYERLNRIEVKIDFLLEKVRPELIKEWEKEEKDGK